MKKRNEKGQFVKGGRAETIEEKIKSFSMPARDSNNYFGIQNYQDFLDSAKLGTEKNRLQAAKTTMENFKDYVNYLQAKKIKIEVSNWTMVCGIETNAVKIGILNHNTDTNLTVFDINVTTDQWKKLLPNERLAIIIVKLQGFIDVVDARIEFLHSKA